MASHVVRGVSLVALAASLVGADELPSADGAPPVAPPTVEPESIQASPKSPPIHRRPVASSVKLEMLLSSSTDIRDALRNASEQTAIRRQPQRFTVGLQPDHAPQ